MLEEPRERPVIGKVKHAQGSCGGSCFGGQEPDGVIACDPLPPGVRFPNEARAALLITFDVEGDYGNGTGDVDLEIANYRRICAHLMDRGVKATFNVVGQMADERGPEFVEWMFDAGGEVASHGYVHDMNKRYGGDLFRAGDYGRRENVEQVRDGVAALSRIRPGSVCGIRMPYGHFNEHTYDAICEAGLIWASNLGIDDLVAPGQGFGGRPFQVQMGAKRYPTVEIPLDTQTFDWSIWMADEAANGAFVRAVEAYCRLRHMPFERTPAQGVDIWRRRMLETIEHESVFTLLCHPINLAVRNAGFGDPVTEFLFPVIDLLGAYQEERKAWVCTCGELAQFYLQEQHEERRQEA